jgi:hypothetical protein
MLVSASPNSPSSVTTNPLMKTCHPELLSASQLQILSIVRN